MQIYFLVSPAELACGCSLLQAEDDVSDAAPLQAAVDGLSDGILHLVIKPGAHLALKQLPEQRFELEASVRETAADVTQRLELQNGLPHDSHQLLCNGFALPASKYAAPYTLPTSCTS